MFNVSRVGIIATGTLPCPCPCQNIDIHVWCVNWSQVVQSVLVVCNVHVGVKHSPFSLVWGVSLCATSGSVVYVGSCALVRFKLALSYGLVLAGVTQVV